MRPTEVVFRCVACGERTRAAELRTAEIKVDEAECELVGLCRDCYGRARLAWAQVLRGEQPRLLRVMVGGEEYAVVPHLEVEVEE